MPAARKVIVAVALGAVLAAGMVVALPWSHDLDDQISIKPQELPIPPPEFSIPVTGKEFDRGLDVERNYSNPIAADAASIARGETKFKIFCTPCHGATGEGGGEVVKRGFVAATNLMSENARSRSDGYIYSYIRHGGPIMPPYAFGIKPEEAWDVVNYIRSRQRETSANR